MDYLWSYKSILFCLYFCSLTNSIVLSGQSWPFFLPSSLVTSSETILPNRKDRRQTLRGKKKALINREINSGAELNQQPSI